MRKKIYAFFGLFLLLGVLLTPWGASPKARAEGSQSYSNIVDKADIVDGDQEAALLSRMKEIDEKYNTNVVILTVKEMKWDGLSGGAKYYDIEDFAADFYDFIYCGGVEKDGIILCINMESNNREAGIILTGSEEKRFKKHLERMMDTVYADLRRESYSKAAVSFVDLVETRHRLGFYPPSVKTVLICVAIGIAVGWGAVQVMKSGMNNVAMATSAGSYLVPGSYQLRRHNELFLYRTVSKQEKQSDRGKGGGSIGSSGFSHSGTSRKF